MKNPFGFYAVLLMVAFSLSNAYSQSTGWQDNGTYKYMQIPKFEKLQFSPDGARFYTYSKDNYIRYFESESGKQVDSFYITQSIIHFFFSSDGYSAIYATEIDQVNVDSLFTLQLDMKKIMLPCKDDAYSQLPQNDFYGKKLAVIDYVFRTGSLLYYLDSVYTNDFHTYSYNKYTGKFKCLVFDTNTKDFTVFLKDSIGQLTSYIREGDSIFFLTEYYQRTISGSEESKMYSKNYYIYSITNDSLYIKNRVPLNSDFEINSEYPDIFMYSKHSDSYTIRNKGNLTNYNSLMNSISKNIVLKNWSKEISMTNDGIFLMLMDRDNKIEIYDQENLKIVDSIKVPNFISKFKIFPSNSDIMCYETNTGKLFRYKSKISNDSIKFLTSTNIVHVQDTVRFLNLSTINPKKYLWYINNLLVSENKHLDYVFDKSGTYDVKLEIIDTTNQSHILIKEKYVKVIEKLKAMFTSDIKSGTFPLTVEFKNTSTGNYGSVNWIFGDGTTSVAVHPEHTYTSAGLYNVKLIVNDDISADTITFREYITIDSFKPEISAITNISSSYGLKYTFLMDHKFIRNNLFYLYCYSDYKSNVYLNYHISTTWQTHWAPYNFSDKHSIDYLVYDILNNTVHVIPIIGARNIDYLTYICPPTVNEYDNKLIFGNLYSFNLSDTSSYKPYFYNPFQQKNCLGHTVYGNTHAFLFDSLLYIAKDTNNYPSNIVKPNLPDKYQISNIVHNNGDGYLVYHTIEGQDGYYLTLTNGSVSFTKKIFDINNYRVAKLFKYKNQNEIVLCGSKKIDNKNSGYIVFLDKLGNIIKDYIFNNCSEIIRMHELPDGKLFFSAIGDSAYCYVIDPISKLVIQGYTLDHSLQKQIVTDIVPANDSTLLFILASTSSQNYWVYRVNLDHKIFKAPLDVQDRSVKDEIELFPNPSNNKITLNLPEIAEGAKIEVYNAMGVIVGEYVYQGDSGTYTIDITGLPIGIYFTKVIGGSAVINGKFVKAE